MSKKIKRISILAVAITFVFAMVFGTTNSVHADTLNGTTEASLKKVLWASVLYQCAQSFGNNIFLQAAKGDKIYQAFADYESYNSFIGTEYGLSTGGNITCRKAAEEYFKTVTITDGVLTNGLLKNVYNYHGSGEKKISCSYGIINSEKSGLIQGGREFYWPAGYYDGADGSHVNMTSHGAIQVVYDDSGPIRLEGDLAGINTEHTLTSMRGWSIDWSNDSAICKNLVQYTEVYSFQTVNLRDEPITAYEPIRSNTYDSITGSFWGNGNNTADAAWLNTASPTGFWHHVEGVTDNSRLDPTSDAAAQFMANIKDQVLGGSDPAGFLNSHANVRYLLYGRFLFNGDNGYAGGCNGTVVLESDISSGRIDTTYWDTSLSYVDSFTAWKDASNKETFRVKYGSSGVAEPGSDRNVSIPNGTASGEYLTCSALMTKFSSAVNSVDNTTTKTTVYNYMGVSPAEELPPEDPGPGPGDDDGGEASVADCYKAAGVLGWVLCPVIKIVGECVESAYTWIENKFLDVDLTSSTSTYSSWTGFRNWANILFAIVFVVVLLSQITGIGISNYGIKKLLPRLIMVVVLTNLSFLICQLAVDVSNILGSELNDTFSNMGNGYDATPATVSTWLLGGLGLATAGGVAALVAWGAGVSFATLGGGLFAILVALLGAMISIFFMLIMLAARQAAVIILIVLAPMAIICYALPNTKSLFDKWFKLFQSLLLVYPICGALVGGGKFASGLIMAGAGENGGIITALVAMLLPVVPFFMVPSIVRSAMNGLGQLGNKISGLGDRLSHGTTGRIRNSERYKDMQRRLKADMAGNAADRMERFNGSKFGKKIANSWLGKSKLGQAYGKSRQERIGYLRERAEADDKMRAHRRAMAGANAAANRRSTFERQEEESAVNDQYVADDNNAILNDGNDWSMTGAKAMYFDDLMNAYATDPSDTAAKTKLLAFQKRLLNSDKGREFLDKKMDEHAKRARDDVAAGNTDAGTARRNAIKEVTSRVTRDGKQIGMLKSVKRGMHDRFNDYAVGNFEQKYTTDENGAQVEISDADYYGARGAMSQGTQTMAGADDSTIQNYTKAIQQGLLSGDEVAHLMSTAQNTIRNKKELGLKGNTEQLLNSLLDAGYASSRRITHGAGHTAGGNALIQGGVSAAGDISRAINQMHGGVQFNAAADAGDREYMRAQAYAENAVNALESGELFSQEERDALESIYETANTMGVRRADGSTFHANPTAIRVRGENSAVDRLIRSYSSGQMSSVANPSVKVDAMNFDSSTAGSIAAEHQHILTQLASGSIDQPTRESLQLQLSAVQDVMARSEAGQDAMYQNFSAVSSAGGANAADALKFASRQIINGSHVDKIDATDAGFSEALTELSSSGTLATGVKYNIRAAQGLSASSLASQSEMSTNRMATEIWSNNTLTSGDAAKLARTVGSVFSTHGASLNAGKQVDFQTIAASCLARQESGVDKTAALAFARTGHEASDGVVSFIHDAANNTANHDQLIRMGQNVRAAYDAKGNTEEAKANLRSILKALDEAGLRDPSNNRSFDPDAPQIIT